MRTNIASHVSRNRMLQYISIRSLSVCWCARGNVGGPQEESKVRWFFLMLLYLNNHYNICKREPKVAEILFLVTFSKPTPEVLTDYTRKVDFLKGLLEAEKLVSCTHFIKHVCHESVSNCQRMYEKY